VPSRRRRRRPSIWSARTPAARWRRGWTWVTGRRGWRRRSGRASSSEAGTATRTTGGQTTSGRRASRSSWPARAVAAFGGELRCRRRRLRRPWLRGWTDYISCGRCDAPSPCWRPVRPVFRISPPTGPARISGRRTPTTVSGRRDPQLCSSRRISASVHSRSLPNAFDRNFQSLRRVNVSVLSRKLTTRLTSALRAKLTATFIQETRN